MWLATDAMGKAMRERRLKFPPKLRRRMYTDRQKAEALQILSEIDKNQRVSERMGVPRSTLSQWRLRYQTDEAFARRIDLFLDAGPGLPSRCPVEDPGAEHFGSVKDTVVNDPSK